MSEFNVNAECYGGFARIQTDYSKDVHIYKIVNAIESNSYCDIPILSNSTPYRHEEIVPVLNVIHCGIDETKVIRVAVKDCDKIILPFIVKHGAWVDNGIAIECSICGKAIVVEQGTVEMNYCPNCGAKMDADCN